MAQWKAELFARRPKVAKMVTNEVLQHYVQERLTGQVRHPDGTVRNGPSARPWNGRNQRLRHQYREWFQGWSPEQISQRLKVDLPRTHR